jgi:uncharacterized protein YndB with AHSA1/START domain
MTVTSVDKDFDKLTFTLIADFDVTVERAWQLWADPRQLERWWGPPMYPATVEEHDLTPGGDVTYYMTSPEGEKHRGYWRVTAVNPPKELDLIDGFANPDGSPNTEIATTTTQVRLSEHNGGTRMELRAVYDTREQMEQVMQMGMEEGIKLAVGQIDAILAG